MATQLAQLDVKAFSCIDSACLQISDMTVIIGPQASGKSVLCKLYYFFQTVITSLPRTIQESDDINDLGARILEEFGEWFRPTSWGPRAFTVRFTTGDNWIHISRGRSKSKVSRAKIAFSESFDTAMLKAFEVLANARKTHPAEPKYIGFAWEHFEAVSKVIHKHFGYAAQETSLYIPAGRSFFTSIGKIVTAFEDRSMLDPVVTRFGRLITSLREHQILEREPKSPLLKTLEKLIDGEVVDEKGKQYLATPDGRSIPFSALSSGQQELLPLLTSLQYVLQYSRHTPHLLYIEEPEAHLFPSAQTDLVEMFSRMVATPKSAKGSQGIRTVLTTHSPYVLAKINNLIKAGSLGSKISSDRRKELTKIIPQGSWLAPSRVKAYAISNRKLIDIIDESGLINADYIDDVSAQTGLEFDSMLELEISLDR